MVSYKSNDPAMLAPAYHHDSEADSQAILGLAASGERPIRHPSGLFHCPGGPPEMHLNEHSRVVSLIAEL